MGRELAQRAAAQRGGDGNEPAKPELTLEQQITRMRPEFQNAMPTGTEAAQLVRDALTCVRVIDKLARCDAASVLGALMTCAQLGLRPGVGALGHAWPIPFWDYKANPDPDPNKKPKGGYRAQLIIGYQGYAELAYRSRRVLNISPRTVYTRDFYQLEYGLAADKLVHRPYLDGPRGDARLYYAVARLANGGYAVTDPMTRQAMEAHRDQFAMTKKKLDGGGFEITGPWRDHFDAMAAKTMVRRLCRLLPKSTDLAMALAVDNGLRVDLNPEADPAEATTPVLPAEVEPTEPPASDGSEPTASGER